MNVIEDELPLISERGGSEDQLYVNVSPSGSFDPEQSAVTEYLGIILLITMVSRDRVSVAFGAWLADGGCAVWFFVEIVTGCETTEFPAPLTAITANWYSVPDSRLCTA